MTPDAIKYSDPMMPLAYIKKCPLCGSKWIGGGTKGKYNSVYLEFECRTVVWETGLTDQSIPCRRAVIQNHKTAIRRIVREIKQAKKWGKR